MSACWVAFQVKGEVSMLRCTPMQYKQAYMVNILITFFQIFIVEETLIAL